MNRDDELRIGPGTLNWKEQIEYRECRLEWIRNRDGNPNKVWSSMEPWSDQGRWLHSLVGSLVRTKLGDCC